MSAADIIAATLSDPAPRDDTLATLAASAGEVWAYVLTAPADDITTLHLGTAAMTLSSGLLCDELIAATTEYADSTMRGFERVPRIGEDPQDATLARMVWVATQIDLEWCPGGGNLLACLGYGFVQNGDIETADLLGRRAMDYGASETLAGSLLTLIAPHLAEAPADDSDGEGWDDDEWAGGEDDWDGDAAEPHPSPPQPTQGLDYTFDPTDWEARLNPPPAPPRDPSDITQPLPVIKPRRDPTNDYRWWRP